MYIVNLKKGVSYQISCREIMQVIHEANSIGWLRVFFIIHHKCFFWWFHCFTKMPNLPQLVWDYWLLVLTGSHREKSLSKWIVGRARIYVFHINKIWNDMTSKKIMSKHQLIQVIVIAHFFGSDSFYTN